MELQQKSGGDGSGGCGTKDVRNDGGDGTSGDGGAAGQRLVLGRVWLRWRWRRRLGQRRRRRQWRRRWQRTRWPAHRPDRDNRRMRRSGRGRPGTQGPPPRAWRSLGLTAPEKRLIYFCLFDARTHDKSCTFLLFDARTHYSDPGLVSFPQCAPCWAGAQPDLTAIPRHDPVL